MNRRLLLVLTAGLLLSAAALAFPPATTAPDDRDWPAGPRGRATTAPAATQPGATDRSPHDVAHGRLPRVTELVQSADGQRIAAAYYVPAWNRPGTDWDAWVAVWDLPAGRRTILPNATGPIALSPDGQHLAAGLYERSAEREHRMQPQTTPALWKVGQDGPANKLAGDLTASQVLAITFSGDGKELIALTTDGRLLAWTVGQDTAAQEIAKLDPSGADKLELATNAIGWGPNLRSVDNHLLLLAPVRRAGQEPIKGLTAEWIRDRDKWTRYVLDTVPLGPAGHLGIGRMIRLGTAGRPFDLALPYDSAEPFQRVSSDVAVRHFPRRLAFAPKERLTAYMAPDAAVAVVSGREPVARFPATDVHAFTPDGRQLIVSDRRGVIRFWDFAANRIARTLRLDDRPADTFLVAAIQAASEFGQPERNRKELERQIAQAAAAGAQVVVLPETAVTGYMDYELKQTWRVGDRAISEGLTGVDPKEAAETVPGPSTEFFAKLARLHGVYLSVTLVEADRKTGDYYNTIVLLGPDGRTLIHYRKLNPWPWAERGWATEGNLGRPVADTVFGRFGVLVCYDIHKQAREMALLKIDTLLYSIAWVEDADSDWFARQLPKRARDHGYHIIAANWTLPRGSAKPSWHGYGQSRVIDSTGRVVARARQDIGPDVVLAELPLPPQ